MCGQVVVKITQTGRPKQEGMGIQHDNNGNQHQQYYQTEHAGYRLFGFIVGTSDSGRGACSGCRFGSSNSGRINHLEVMVKVSIPHYLDM
jgi:hypothetical protein